MSWIPPRVVFRADASPSIGAGHVMRCLSLAEEMSAFGWECAFVVNPGADRTVPSLVSSGHDLRCASGAASLSAYSDASMVVVDHYGLDAAFEAKLKSSGHTVVVFDDLADRSHVCDILVDPTPGRTPADYAALAPDAMPLLGPRHALIGRRWRIRRSDALVRRREARSVSNVLVSMGATDPSNATRRVLSGIAASGLGASVDVVLGRAAPQRACVERALGPGMTLHIDPPNLPDIVVRADIVIGAAGTSSYERAVLGVPSVLIRTADNQRFVAAALEAVGAAETVPAAELDDPVALGARIAALARDGSRRSTMARAAFGLSDGRGATRLLAALAEEHHIEGGDPIRLRVAEVEDEAWLLQLQRQPLTRRFARNPVIPDEDEHRRWFGVLLDDVCRHLFIVQMRGEPVGMIRLDRAEQERMTFEISIALDARWHRRGVGRAALILARRIAPGANLVATVLPENTASRALFSACGYRPEPGNRLRSVAPNIENAAQHHQNSSG